MQNRDGWVLHPLDELLRRDGGGKLRSIPVRLLFNDPSLNLRADYSLFDRSTGRPICVGNGESCRRRGGDEGIETLPCLGPDLCRFAGGECKAYARFNAVIGDGEEDALGSFVLRTTSFNTIRTLAARLQYFCAVSGGRLACMPLELKLRGKSTAMSHRTAIYYVDLVVRTGMTLEQAISEAREKDVQRKDNGFDQKALDEAARQGFANGAFEDMAEDVPSVIEEFYPEAESSGARMDRDAPHSLSSRLEAKVARLGT